MAKTTELFSSK